MKLQAIRLMAIGTAATVIRRLTSTQFVEPPIEIIATESFLVGHPRGERLQWPKASSAEAASSRPSASTNPQSEPGEAGARPALLVARFLLLMGGPGSLGDFGGRWRPAAGYQEASPVEQGPLDG
jgi:hypothetical protein